MIPYTKKVLEHFNKPHNYGKMKNPDAVGEVGNVICVAADTLLHTDLALNPIRVLRPKDRVLSHDGSVHNIKKVFKSESNNNLIAIKNKFGVNFLTKEHLVMALKLPGRRMYAYTKNKKRIISQVAWYHAKDIRRGDILVYPITTKVVNVEKMLFDFKRSKWDFKSINIPNRIPINNDFLRIAGYYLSEGYVRDAVSRMQVGFTFNLNEKHYALDVANVIKSIFGLEARFINSEARNTCYVYFNSVFLVQIFKEYFGKGAANKKIPDFIMNLPLAKQRALIQGLWRGDGYLNLKRKGRRAGFSSISINLIHQLKLLLLRQGIVPSIYYEDEKISADGTKHRKSYRIHVGETEFLKILCSILDVKFSENDKRVNVHSWISENFAFLPVTSWHQVGYSGLIYNLEVAGSRSFLSDSLCLHNCGDLMRIYLKIGLNKQKQEIIKGIKFETYGCLAAIASSSMVTDLVKGKTLEEALGFNREEIVQELGGLPPIKIHCSVLATDALLEAVYDYLRKKKRPIPEKLKARHTKLAQEKGQIEKRHQQK